jgi:ribonuclease-3
MAEAEDLVHRGAREPDRVDELMEPVADWAERALGHRPVDQSLFERALTHSSRADEDDYERLEFLGDRVLGLAIADWLYATFPDEPEGKLSRRLNALVARETCAEVARELGLGDWVRLGKQARDDGASDSDNVIGDVVE